MKENISFHTPVLLALLTVSAYFLADTVDMIIGAGLSAAPDPSVSLGQTSSASWSNRQLTDYASVLERGLFGDGKGPSSSPAVVESTPYTLIGTVEGESFAGAVLAVGKDQDFYQINRKMPDGSTIIKVMRDKVTLRRSDGSTVIIEIQDNAKIVPVPAQRNGYPGVQRISGSNFVVDQREVLASTENINQILTQARALPFMEQGKVTGFRISEIVPGSIFAKIGLQNGDVIQQVNSQALNDPGKFFQLYQGLREERNISLDVMRNGRRQTMNYEIR